MKNPNMKISNRLTDPFRYVAGGKALAWGAAILRVEIGWLGFAGFYQNTYLHFAPVAGRLPLVRTAAMQLAMWLVPALLLWGCGALLSRSKIRAVDIFGTTALAQAPLLLLVLPLGCGGVAGRLESASGAAGEALALLAFALFSLVVLAWFFVWNYRAYAVSCNLRGWRAAVSYIAVIAAVTAASQFVTL